MRQHIYKLGRPITVGLITLFVIIAALCLDLLMVQIQGDVFNVRKVIRVVVITSILGPLTSWYLIGLLLKLHELEVQMANLAQYDDMTGLQNRRYFMSSFQHHHDRIVSEKEDLALLVIDLDHFKKINDQYGHAAGDAVLKAFGTLLNKTKRKADLAGRIGGEEFGVMLPFCDVQNAAVFVAKLMRAVKLTPVDFNGQPIRYSMSIGLSTCRQHMQSDQYASPSELLRLADAALYRAKRNGRNRLEIAGPAEPTMPSH